MNNLSTIYVDDREVERANPNRPGEKTGTDMLALVLKHRAHPPARHKHLVAGDFCFSGEGPKGPCLIGVERKRVKDMMTSIRSGRFSGEQIPKLINHYDFTFLVIEGRYRTNWVSGVLEDKWGRDYSPIVIGKSSFLGLELEAFLVSLAACTPIRVVRTRDEKETVDFLITLNHSFSAPWEKQISKVTAIHQPEQYATVGKASTLRRFAHSLSGLGWERSGTVEQNFDSVWDALSTDPNCKCIRPAKDYEKLPGFGKVLSQRVFDQVHGNYDPDTLE